MKYKVGQEISATSKDFAGLPTGTLLKSMSGFILIIFEGDLVSWANGTGERRKSYLIATYTIVYLPPRQPQIGDVVNWEAIKKLPAGSLVQNIRNGEAKYCLVGGVDKGCWYLEGYDDFYFNRATSLGYEYTIVHLGEAK